uniref:Calponin-homology (CH) domain-containing protein n=1 Tax=Schistocephalus solidus TaxID=70667 RepID=A0A183TKG3_SCHSO
LLAWCQEVTRGYANVCINDFSTSFRSGLGFCAILHHFVPELVPGLTPGDACNDFRVGVDQADVSRNFDSLDVKNERENVRLAFDAAAKLGIPRMLDPLEVAPPDRDRPPDRLGIMTYLHQLRMHFSKPLVTLPESKSVDSPPPGAKPATPLPNDMPSASPLSATTTNTRMILIGPNEGFVYLFEQARASARYDQLLAKARTLLEESRTSSDNAPVAVPPITTTGSSPSPAANRNSDDPNSKSISVVAEMRNLTIRVHGGVSEALDRSIGPLDITVIQGSDATLCDISSFDSVDQVTTVENVNPSPSVKIRRLKLSNLKLFSDGLEPSRRSSSRNRSTYANGVGDRVSVWFFSTPASTFSLFCSIAR